MPSYFARIAPLAALLVVAVLSGLPYLTPGQPTSPDIWSHLARQKIVYESLRDGGSPFYTFMFYSGYPHLRFYSPLFAFLAGALTLLWRGDLVPPLKVLLFGLHLLSGLAMWLFLRRRTAGQWAAALGAGAYLLVPWRTLHIATLANLPQSLIYVLMPLAFLSADAVVERSNFRHALLLGLWTALALVSHLFSAAWVLLLLAAWAAFHLDGEPEQGPPRSSRLLLLGSALLTALLLSAWNTIPFALEYSGHSYPLPDIDLPLPRLAALLLPWAKPGGFIGGYLGLSVVLLALGGLTTLLVSRSVRRTGLALAVMLVLVVLLAFGVPAWRPTRLLLTTGLPGIRFMVLFVFVAGAAVGLGWSALERRLRPRAVTLCALGVFAVLSLDCIPHILRIRNSTDLDFLSVRNQAFRCIREERPVKVLDLYSHADRIDDFKRLACFPAMGFIYGDLPTVQGPAYYQFAPRSMRYVYSWSNLVAADLATGADRLSGDALKALALMGLSHLLTPPSPAGDSLVFLKQGLDWEDRFLRAGMQPPLAYGRTGIGLLLCSDRLQPLPAESLVLDRTLLVASDWPELLRASDIDIARRSLAFIPVCAGPAAAVGTEPAVLTESTAVANDRVTSRFAVSAGCFLRLALSYYPWLSVRLDGRPVAFGETRDHFIWLECPAGRHTLAVSAPLTPLRATANWLSASSLLALAAVFVFAGPALTGRDRKAD